MTANFQTFGRPVSTRRLSNPMRLSNGSRARSLKNHYRTVVVGGSRNLAEAKLIGDPQRRRVVRMDDAGHPLLRPMLDRPDRCGSHRFFGEAAAMLRTDEPSTRLHRALDCRRQGSMEIMETGLADEGSCRLILNCEKAEAEKVLESDLSKETDPGGLARHRRAADVTDHGRFRPHRGIELELLNPIGAQPKPGCFEDGNFDHGKNLRCRAALVHLETMSCKPTKFGLWREVGAFGDESRVTPAA